MDELVLKAWEIVQINYQPELATAGYLSHQQYAKGGIDTLLFEVIWRWTSGARRIRKSSTYSCRPVLMGKGFSQHPQEVSNFWKGAEKVKDVSILLFSGYPLRRWLFELTFFSRGTPRCRCRRCRSSWNEIVLAIHAPLASPLDPIRASESRLGEDRRRCPWKARRRWRKGYLLLRCFKLRSLKKPGCQFESGGICNCN